MNINDIPNIKYMDDVYQTIHHSHATHPIILEVTAKTLIKDRTDKKLHVLE